MGKGVYGLLGRTLKHSYSVQIHRALGNTDYALIELEPEELPGFLKRDDIRGLNVTIPYKRDVMPYCGGLSPEASAIGSVNTIVRGDDGILRGYNTDAYGLSFMAARANISLSGRKVVIFGSGGASLTAQAVAGNLGAAQVIVVSRGGENNYKNLSKHFDAEILINATPLGMYPDTDALPAEIADFPKCEGVLDLIYNPRRTAFLMRAEELRIPFSGGLPMLVAQAKTSEELFFGKTIPDSENERILCLIGRDASNIVLIGMPGSGKSTVGRELAKLTGREAVDIDAEIIKTAGKPIGDIFADDGEGAFRRLEREAVAKAGKESGKIIITGGGVVKDFRNYSSLHRNGRIYHIARDISALPREGRPLSKNADLEAMYSERLPLYEKFRDAVIPNDGTPENTAKKIWRDFGENSGD